jgi:thermitase
VPGEIVVKFQSHIDLADAQDLLRAAGLQPLEVSPRSRLIRVQVAPNQEAETIAHLTAWEDIAFATYNYRVEAVGDPNDPDYGRQWALKQTDDHDIDAPEGWDIHVGSDNSTIAIIDTGVDLDHPDLQANIVPGYDFVNGDSTSDDDHGHGTHVAGIAAAVGNNGVGIAGVNWTAGIMPLKVLDATGSGTSYDLSQAVYYAVDNGANVINMSLGAPSSKWPCDWHDVEDAFNYTLDNGVLVVVAAGNDGQDGVNCPAAYEQVVAVGSTTASDTRSAFSNYGPRLDIAAPGNTIYSTLPGGYGSSSGTSMAAPHVAGLATLLWSFVPSLTDNQVRDIRLEAADDLYPSASDDCGSTYPFCFLVGSAPSYLGHGVDCFLTD